MSFPIARSAWECQVFLSLATCSSCLGTGLEMTGYAVRNDPAGQLWHYVAQCVQCGSSSEFTFRGPREPAPAYPAFGSAAPSQLLDAGQFLGYAEESAELVPADPADLDPTDPEELTVAEAFEEIGVAVAAVEEALKFIPAGQTAVPVQALWAPASATRYEDDPLIFQRRHLMAILGAYKETHAAYSRVAS